MKMMTRLSLTSNGFSIPIHFLINLILSAILFAGFYFLPFPQILPCTYPLIEKIILAICFALIIQILGFQLYRANRALWLMGVDFVSILLALWLGIYSISPLGFSNGKISIAQGFVLTRSMRPDQTISSSETINVLSGSVIAIKAITLPMNKNCVWLSTKGGSFDDSGSCDIVYMPPTNSDFDLLKVLIQPACHLPEVQENIKIMVLP